MMRPATSLSEKEADASEWQAAIEALILVVELALQLRFWKMSESMGNHDSEVVDASSVD
jgi:hypothetical protein